MRKIILYLFLANYLSSSLLSQTVVEKYFYYGNGVSFKIPEQWQLENIESFNEGLISQYFVQQSNFQSGLVFNSKIDGNKHLVLFEKWPGSASYSVSLQKSISSITYSYLNRIKCLDVIQDKPPESNLMVDAVRSVHLKFKCRKNQTNYFHLSTLIPTGQNFIYYHVLIPDKYEDEIKASYYLLIDSFIGARLSKNFNDNFGVLLQILVMCIVLIAIRLYKVSSHQ